MERLDNGLPEELQGEEQLSDEKAVPEADWTPLLEAAEKARPEWERLQAMRIREMQVRNNQSNNNSGKLS
jgi:hypothetical protein